jgi:hypothetical protein
MVRIASVDLGSVNYAWCVLDVIEIHTSSLGTAAVSSSTLTSSSSSAVDSIGGYVHLTETICFKILDWKLEQLVETKNGKSIQDLVSIAVADPSLHYYGMINKWRELKVDMVVLETQLNDNITTKVLSHVLQALVESHLLGCSLMFLNGKETIPWITKVMEIMSMENPDFVVPDVHDRKGKKKASVYSMEFVLKKTGLLDHPGWTFAKEKKKLDDISDVYWQAMTAVFPLATNTRRKKIKALKLKQKS